MQKRSPQVATTNSASLPPRINHHPDQFYQNVAFKSSANPKPHPVPLSTVVTTRKIQRRPESQFIARTPSEQHSNSQFSTRHLQRAPVGVPVTGSPQINISGSHNQPVIYSNQKVILTQPVSIIPQSIVPISSRSPNSSIPSNKVQAHPQIIPAPKGLREIHIYHTSHPIQHNLHPQVQLTTPGQPQTVKRLRSSRTTLSSYSFPRKQKSTQTPDSRLHNQNKNSRMNIITNYRKESDKYYGKLLEPSGENEMKELSDSSRERRVFGTAAARMNKDRNYDDSQGTNPDERNQFIKIKNFTPRQETGLKSHSRRVGGSGNVNGIQKNLGAVSDIMRMTSSRGFNGWSNTRRSRTTGLVRNNNNLHSPNDTPYRRSAEPMIRESGSRFNRTIGNPQNSQNEVNMILDQKPHQRLIKPKFNNNLSSAQSFFNPRKTKKPIGRKKRAKKGSKKSKKRKIDKDLIIAENEKVIKKFEAILEQISKKLNLSNHKKGSSQRGLGSSNIVAGRGKGKKVASKSFKDRLSYNPQKSKREKRESVEGAKQTFRDLVKKEIRLKKQLKSTENALKKSIKKLLEFTTRGDYAKSFKKSPSRAAYRHPKERFSAKSRISLKNSVRRSFTKNSSTKTKINLYAANPIKMWSSKASVNDNLSKGMMVNNSNFFSKKSKKTENSEEPQELEVKATPRQPKAKLAGSRMKAKIEKNEKISENIKTVNSYVARVLEGSKQRKESDQFILELLEQTENRSKFIKNLKKDFTKKKQKRGSKPKVRSAKIRRKSGNTIVKDLNIKKPKLTNYDYLSNKRKQSYAKKKNHLRLSNQASIFGGVASKESLLPKNRTVGAGRGRVSQTTKYEGKRTGKRFT